MKNSFFTIKNDPLRAFPAEMPNYQKKFLVRNGEAQENNFTPQPGQTQINVEVLDGGHLILLFAANYSAPDYRLLNIEAKVGRDASLHIIDRALGGNRVETQANVTLAASGATCKFTGMYHGKNTEHHASQVIIQHAAPRTRGDVFVRGVYEGESRAVFTGLIKIHPDAQQTTSYYRDDILLLDQALADSLPTLEIEANDVKASHGSTTSRLDDEQLFYLQSRGLSAQQARNLIVAGFLTPALKRVPEALCQPFLPAD